MHLPLLLQTICLAAEILSLSYHPSSSPQILSSLCNEGFLSKLFFLAFHTLPASKLHSTASTHWEHLGVTNCCHVRLARKRMMPFGEEK